MTLEAIPDGVIPLVGLTKPGRFRGRGQATPGPPDWGLGVVLTTSPHKTIHVTDTQTRVNRDIPPRGEDGPSSEGFMMQGEAGSTRKPLCRKSFNNHHRYMERKDHVRSWKDRTNGH